MANINQMQNDFDNAKSIRLTNLTQITSGQLALAGSINGLITSTYTIATVPLNIGVSSVWSISEIVFKFNDVTGLTGTMVASMGNNSATYDNVMPSTTFTGFNALNQQYRYQVSGTSRLLYSSDVLTLNITTPFGGGGSVYFDVYVYGEVI